MGYFGNMRKRNWYYLNREQTLNRTQHYLILSEQWKPLHGGCISDSLTSGCDGDGGVSILGGSAPRSASTKDWLHFAVGTLQWRLPAVGAPSLHCLALLWGCDGHAGSPNSLFSTFSFLPFLLFVCVFFVCFVHFYCLFMLIFAYNNALFHRWN